MFAGILEVFLYAFILIFLFLYFILSVDKSWYRAVVVENSHPQYLVNFFDFGNSDYLNITSLRKMEEKFMELDIQAHMCSLSGEYYLLFIYI